MAAAAAIAFQHAFTNDILSPSDAPTESAYH
jgi:hypothetical protein